jgi:hypothetical protein
MKKANQVVVRKSRRPATSGRTEAKKTPPPADVVKAFELLGAESWKNVEYRDAEQFGRSLRRFSLLEDAPVTYTLTAAT